jgi:hypothetical protein
MIVEVNKQKYVVNDNEFNFIAVRDEICNLKIIDKLGLFERLISLIKELTEINKKKFKGIFFNQTHGGYIPLECASCFDKIHILNSDNDNINLNLLIHNIKNVLFINDFQKEQQGQTDYNYIVFSEKFEHIDKKVIQKLNPIILTISNTNQKLTNYHTFSLTNTDYSLFVPDIFCNDFYNSFYYFIQNSNALNYDNLIHLCIMVKNGGEQFEEMLLENIDIIDRWTILDTGSTDNTVNIINKVLPGKKKGELFNEPFINFRDSRNRLLELAGEKCKFIIMLDDTYVVKGKLREFLNEIRGDQFSDSFSLLIQSDDTVYSSNRVLKTRNKLKYIYKIHEVVQKENNINVNIPQNESFVVDRRFDYMETRTFERKQNDLKLLFEELEEDPDNPRTHYYLAQTYNLLEDYEKTYYYYLERVNHPVEGFINEKADAAFEAARCANYKLNKSWDICKELYLKSYELNKNNCDSLYFIGIHYYLINERKEAFDYFKKAFSNNSYANPEQLFFFKPTLYYHYLPKFLTELCFYFEDYELGEKSAKVFLDNNLNTSDMYNVVASWYNIFLKFNQSKLNLKVSFMHNENKPLLCFVADGGFEPWCGLDIISKGVGGSETYIIEMARHIQKQGIFKVIVFCNCLGQSIFEKVEYIPINHFSSFVKNNYIHSCIISRFSEYIPLAVRGQTKNVYFVLHDTVPSGLIIPIDEKLKNIFCLSEWHIKTFLSVFPQFEKITVPLYNGIDINKFNNEKKITKDNVLNSEINLKENINIEIFETTKKIPLKFIYSSFPNRGLLQLLQMWIKIVSKYPIASLHIYSDVDGKWANSVEPTMMKEIKDMLKFFNENKSLNVFYYGWVNKDTLAEAWKTSEYWLYPCIFNETFCITALEAAVSKTLAITNGLAALQNTVADRGICIEGDATTKEWQEKALSELFSIIEDKNKKEYLLELNYNWGIKLSWNNQANKLLNDFLLKN